MVNKIVAKATTAGFTEFIFVKIWLRWGSKFFCNNFLQFCDTGEHSIHSTLNPVQKDRPIRQKSLLYLLDDFYLILIIIFIMLIL